MLRGMNRNMYVNQLKKFLALKLNIEAMLILPSLLPVIKYN